jgi:3-oxoacyl-[acyl-carrier-protein] synthase III
VTGRHAVLAGLGACLPSEVVTNEQLAARLGLDDADWIASRTGIRQRHVVAKGGTTSDLAVEAGRRALASAGVTDVDALVLATSTPDQSCPATAPAVAARLGLAGIAALDVAAVCTGFIYALATGAGLITTGTARSVLVIGADVFSTIVDPADRATSAVFGDGGGGVVLRAAPDGAPGALHSFHLGSDGTRADLIVLSDRYLRMSGQAVFGQAVKRMAESVRATAALAGWPVDSVDRFVLHQANVRILTAVARRLEVPEGRFITNLERVGNTVAASVPLALTDATHRGDLRPGDRVLLAGFGGGLTWGSVALVWPRVTAAPVLITTPQERTP